LGGGLDALRRVCKIVVDLPEGQVKGSGFLIGQDTVLTSHHVIEKLLAAADDDSHRRLSVQFDSVGSWLPPKTVKVAQKWYVDGSEAHPSEKAGKAPLDFTTANAQDFDKYLDYAVIRTAE